jgi:cold shock CspA family protein
MKGKVRTFFPERSYGFCTRLDNYESIFFHIANLNPRSEVPDIGDTIEFDLAVRPDGREHAVNIKVLNPAQDGAR